MAALAPAARMEERRAGAGFLGGRSGEPARAAILRGLGGRACQVASCRSDFRHAAIRTAPWRSSAPGHHDDAAANRAAEAPDRGPFDRDHACTHTRECLSSRAGLSRHDPCALRQYAAWAAGDRRRIDRRSRRRAVVARDDRGLPCRRTAYDIQLAQGGPPLLREGLYLKATDRIYVWSSATGVSAVVYGKEVAV